MCVCARVRHVCVRARPACVCVCARPAFVCVRARPACVCARAPAQVDTDITRHFVRDERYERFDLESLIGDMRARAQVDTDITRHFPLASLINAFLRLVPERNTPAQARAPPHLYNIYIVIIL